MLSHSKYQPNHFWNSLIFFSLFYIYILLYNIVVFFAIQWQISHGFTCIPHSDPPSHLPLHPIPLGLPSAPALSTCFMHPTWAGILWNSLIFKLCFYSNWKFRHLESLEKETFRMGGWSMVKFSLIFCIEILIQSYLHLINSCKTTPMKK